MNGEEIARSEKFALQVKAGGGPGGCNSPATCKAYCGELSNMDECVQFAGEHNFKGQEYEQGKKIASFLKSGGKMPGGCTSRATCQAYCGDFSHAEECFAFAEKAGIAQARGDESGSDGEGRIPTPEQFKKLSELAQKGETPGGCKNKNECMAYCRTAGHFEECTAFGQRVGFIGKDEAERIKKFQGKGPGGCNSPESCHAYCNDEANRETCFKFAEENGLIPKEELKRMKEGWVRMRQGLENTPPEVKECLGTTLGPSIIEDIQSGKLVPGPDVGERMRGCFEKFGGRHDPKKVFEEAPEGTRACLKEKLGDTYESISSGKTEPTPETGDTFRVCFEQMRFEQGGFGGGERRTGQGFGGDQGQGAEKLQGFLRSAPREVASCLKERLGDEFEKLESGASKPTPELSEKMHACFEQFRPEKPRLIGPPIEGDDKHQGIPGIPGRGMSPEVEACLKEKLGQEALDQFKSGRPTPEVEQVLQLCSAEFGKTRPGIAPDGNFTRPPEFEGETPLPFPAPTPSSNLNPSQKGCYKGGCSGQICSDDPSVITTCEYRAEYACYKTARCERQANGQCGWTETQELQICLNNPPRETTSQIRSFTRSLLGGVALPFFDPWELRR